MLHPRRHRKAVQSALACACLLALTSAGVASAEVTGSGGAVFIPPPPPPKKARIYHGRAIAPRSAPRRVRHVITAANRLIGKPYRYGGGHVAFTSGLDTGYDCSRSVSYALYGGRFLRSPPPSTDLMSLAPSGAGRWVTLYAHNRHPDPVGAGLPLRTSI